MGKKKKFVVYSTNPNFENPFEELNDIFTPPPAEQRLRIWLNRIKGNKEVTVVKGYEGSEESLKELGTELKKKCGTGGSVKDGEILIQGDHRDKVLDLLISKGYQNTKKSGG